MPMMQLRVGRHARLQVTKAPGAARRRGRLRVATIVAVGRSVQTAFLAILELVVANCNGQRAHACGAQKYFWSWNRPRIKLRRGTGAVLGWKGCDSCRDRGDPGRSRYEHTAGGTHQPPRWRRGGHSCRYRSMRVEFPNCIAETRSMCRRISHTVCDTRGTPRFGPRNAHHDGGPGSLTARRRSSSNSACSLVILHSNSLPRACRKPCASSTKGKKFAFLHGML